MRWDDKPAPKTFVELIETKRGVLLPEASKNTLNHYEGQLEKLWKLKLFAERYRLHKYGTKLPSSNRHLKDWLPCSFTDVGRVPFYYDSRDGDEPA